MGLTASDTTGSLALPFVEGGLDGLAVQAVRGSVRPIVKWAGGKRALLPALSALAPGTFRNYLEPFVGGGSFFFHLAPECGALGDANADLVELYRTVRDAPAELMTALDRLRPWVEDRDEYYRLRAIEPNDLEPVERAARFMFLNKVGFNGLYRVNRRGGFNVPFGAHTSPPTLYDRANLVQAAALLRRVSLEHSDFEAVFARAGSGDFAYVDPPYVPLTTTANFTQYTAGSFGEPDQRRLAETIERAVARGCSVLLSNSDTPLVHELYARYKIHTLRANRNINSDGTKRQKVTELAIQAFPR